MMDYLSIDCVLSTLIRNMEMTLRRRDVNNWMSHRQFPDDIRTYVSCVSLSKLNFEELRCPNTSCKANRIVVSIFSGG